MSTALEIDYQQPAIEVTSLCKTFGTLKAVDGVSFRIEHGSVVGFVGANGAGKTTTMRILATLEQPSSGSARIGGHHVMHYPDKVRRLLGWMPDAFGTYDNMTVLEYLDFYARALGYRGEERVQRIQEVMDFVDLTPLADRLSNKMSKGQTQRLCLGRALLHDPQILIMDEPAAGLDPKARVELKSLIRLLSEEGKTILISSHILSELGEMCDSLLFIDKGSIVHHGDAQSMTQASGAPETLVHVQVAGEIAKLAEWAITAPQVKMLEETKRGARLRIESTDELVIANTLKRLVNEGIPVVDFHREERRLEDAFIDMLGRIDKAPKTGETRTHADASAQPPPPLPVQSSEPDEPVGAGEAV